MLFACNKVSMEAAIWSWSFSWVCSLFQMKFSASATKSSHQDRGPCYFHLPIFFIYIHCSSAGKQKVVVIAVFLDKLDHRPLFNDIYYKSEDWFRYDWQTSHTNSLRHVSENPLSFSHYCSLLVIYVWISKWVNLHCNWINLISVLNFLTL